MTDDFYRWLFSNEWVRDKKGGKGSGHFGHAGRTGKRGDSAPVKDGNTSTETSDKQK